MLALLRYPIHHLPGLEAVHASFPELGVVRLAIDAAAALVAAGALLFAHQAGVPDLVVGEVDAAGGDARVLPRGHAHGAVHANEHGVVADVGRMVLNRRLRYLAARSPLRRLAGYSWHLAGYSRL